MNRNSRSQMFFKIDALKKIAIFIRKHLKACNFINKTLQHRCFPVAIEKFSKAAFFMKQLRFLLLNGAYAREMPGFPALCENR